MVALNAAVEGDDNSSMATDITATPAITARLRPTFALQPVSEIELDYDGATPPTGLLAELSAIGWEGATACPPPASAIDWSRPDPVRGTRHTIRPFPATTTAVLRGTEAHRSAILAATRTLLRDYGIGLEADGRPHRDGPPTPPGATGADPAVVGPVRLQPPAGGAPPRPLARSSSPTGDAAAAGGAPPQGSGRRIEVVVASAQAEEAARRLADVGTVVDEQADLWTTAITYRGNTQETVHPARRLTFDLGVGGVDVTLVLAGLTVWSVR